MEPARIDYFNNGDILHLKNLGVCYPTITKEDIISIYSDLSEALSLFSLSVAATFLRDGKTLDSGVSDRNLAEVVVRCVGLTDNHSHAMNDFVDMLMRFFDHVKTPGGSIKVLKDDVAAMKIYAETYVKGQVAVIGASYTGPTVNDYAD